MNYPGGKVRVGRINAPVGSPWGLPSHVRGLSGGYGRIRRVSLSSRGPSIAAGCPCGLSDGELLALGLHSPHTRDTCVGVPPGAAASAYRSPAVCWWPGPVAHGSGSASCAGHNSAGPQGSAPHSRASRSNEEAGSAWCEGKQKSGPGIGASLLRLRESSCPEYSTKKWPQGRGLIAG